MTETRMPDAANRNDRPESYAARLSRLEAPFRLPSPPARGKATLVPDPHVTQMFDAEGTCVFAELATDELGGLVLLATAAAVLLGRIARLPTVALAIRLSRRDYEGGVVPLIVDLTPGQSLHALIARVADDLADAMGDPMGTMAAVHANGLAGSVSDITLTHAAWPDDDVRVPEEGITIRLRADHAGIDMKGSGAFEADFITGFAESVAGWMGQFKQLDQPLADIGWCEEPSLAAMPQVSQSDAHVTLIGIFLSAAEAYGDATALISDDSSMTYAELESRSAALARRLRAEQNCGRESLVGVLFDRSPEMVVAVLGIIRAGAAFVPLDPSYPVERIRQIAQDASLHLVLCGEDLDEKLPDGTKTVRIDGRDRADGVDSVMLPDVLPQDLAYVLYTSGSTGRPKGCALEHHNIANYIAWACDYYFPNGEGGNFGLYSSLCFDFTLTNLFCPLARGKTLRLYPQHQSIDTILARAFAPDSGIDTMKLTPAHISLIDDLVIPSGTCVRRAIVGGEDLLPRHVRILRELNAEIEIFNEYGPTEAAVGCIVKRIDDSDGPILIGRPIRNTQVFITDEFGHACAPMVTGEICVAGDSVARGYYGRDDLTAARFVKLRGSGVRAYRTGDLGRYWRNGELQCFGRADDQVKIRGFRVELGEVESVLSEHPAVSMAAVIVRTAVDGMPTLAGYVRLGCAVDTAALRAHLAQRLPSYMVPATITVLERAPLNANGKLDRRALAAMVEDIPDNGGITETASLAPDEARALSLLSDLVPAAMTRLDGDLIDLGMDSLRVMRLLGRLWRDHAVEMTIDEAFAARTPRDLAREIAARVGQGSARPGDAEFACIPRGPRHDLSLAQRRLWLLDRIDGAGSAYHVVSAIEVEGALDDVRLAAALTALVARHEILRTVYPDEGGIPYAKVLPPMPAEFEVTILADQASLDKAISHVAMRPLDLATGPLFRTSLFRFASGRQVLCLVLHHLLCDAWSGEILTGELAALYRGEDLPTQRLQYLDFVAWQHEHVETCALDKAIGGAVARLRGAPQALTLPLDAPRPETPRFDGAVERRVLSAVQTTALRATGQAAGATLANVLLAAWAALLCRISGQTDLVIGMPVSHRPHPDLDTVLGLFVNSVALRLDLSDDPCVAELIGRARLATREAVAEAAVPFESVVTGLDLMRDTSVSPVFQVMFAHETPVLEKPDANDPDGITWRPLALPGIHAKFDLTLHASETEAGVELTFEYRTDLFTSQSASRLLRWYDTVLNAFVASTDHPATRIDLLEDAERARVLALGTGPLIDYDAAPIHEMVARQAASTPNSVAVMSENGEDLTYSALLTASDALATRLAARGVRPGMPVGVSIQRSADLVVALLGVLRAGGAYVPIDPDLPASRIAHIIAQAGIKLAVVDHDPVAALVVDGITLLSARDADDTLTETPMAAGLDDLAYVIFTSGSTGRPKGARNLHSGIANRLLWMQATYPIGPHDVVLQKTRASFDVSVWELFWPLITGARLLLASPSAGGDPAYIAAMIARYAVSVVHFVPAVLRAFLAENGAEELSSLRHVFCSGEALTTDLVHQLRTRVTCPVHNLYGPTEAAVDVTHHTCTVGETAKIVPIGRPISNLHCHVVDTHGLLCPPGVPGELLLGGIGVGDGYQHAPELTAERFVPDSWSNDPGARLYRTGDLVRMSPEGEIAFLGRLDHQVKLRGQRIELGEVEVALRAYHGVHDAIASVRQGPISAQLIAHVAMDQRGADVTRDALRRHLAASLPAYMIPAWFVIMDSFPLLPNGKVDRRALPEPHEKQPVIEMDAAPVPPDLAEREALLAEIWRGVLRVEAIGRHDNFFASGGDSILAMQVVARAARMGIDLTARQMFQAQTIADLARLAPVRAVVSAVPRTGDTPAIPMQRWLAAQTLPDFERVQQSILLSVPTTLDESRLTDALTAMMEHHEALGLCLEGETMRLSANASLDFAVEMLSHDFGTDLRAAVIRDAEGIDPLRGPIFRARLYRSPSESTARLWLGAHHAATDAVSWRILLDDLATLYAGGSLPQASASLRAWAFAIRDAARSEAGHEAAHAWLRRLSDAPLPYGSARAAAMHTHGHAVTIAGRVDAATTQTLLTKTAPGLGVRFEDLLLGALAVAWDEVMGQDRLLVDVEGHGRDNANLSLDLSRTVGWFTAIVPHLMRRAPGDGVGDVARTIHADREPGYLDPTALRFGSEDPSLARAFETLPRATILFNYHGKVESDVAVDAAFGTLADEDIELPRNPDARCSHPIEIVGSVSATGLETSWTYGGRLHTSAVMEELVSTFEAALRAVAATAPAPARARFALSPLQEGMLFHHLYETGRDDNFQQSSVEVIGPLDAARLRAAWESVVRRHAALRTAFDWGEGRDPTQVVEADVTLPWTEHDLSGQDGLDAARSRSARLLAQDRVLGIDLRRAPVLRCALHHLDKEHAVMAWSTHHILLDGWSVAILVDEVLQTYRAPELWRDPAPPFSLYLDWLAARDATSDAHWWRRELANWQSPTRLPGVSARPSGGEVAVLMSEIDAVVLKALERRARRAHITMNALIRAAYALLLGRICGVQDVVFGAVIAGRPPELPGSDAMLGMFINTIAVRPRFSQDEDFDAFAARLALRQAEAESHGTIPLVEVRRITSLPANMRLFDALLVFENFPTTEMEPDGSALRFGALQMPQTDPGTPVCLTVIPGVPYQLHFAYDAERIDAADATGWRDALIGILTVLADDAPCRVNTFLSGAAAPAGAERAVTAENRSCDDMVSETERALLDLWKTLLERADIGLDDDYFELGGHSILAVRMMSRIEKLFDRRLPISVVFENSTVRRLARLLVSDDRISRTALVTLRSAGSGTPLFLFPGAGGHALYFQPLVRALEAMMPVYGLEAIMRDENATQLTSVGAIAAHHVTLIREVRGNGPYRLCGHSFGALVAIEVARQLRNQGARVEDVIVIDTVAPPGSVDHNAPPADGGASYWKAWDEIDWLLAIAHEIGVFLAVDLGVKREGLAALPADARLPDVAARIAAAGDTFADVGPERLLDYLHTYRAQFAMTYVAAFPALEVPITLLRSTDAEPGDHEASADVAALRARDEGWGWSRLTTEPVAVHDVPGTHLSCLMSPNATAIARIIDRAHASIEEPTP